MISKGYGTSRLILENNINSKITNNFNMDGEFEYETEPVPLQYGPIGLNLSFDFKTNGTIESDVQYISRSNNNFIVEGKPGNIIFNAFEIHPNFSGENKKVKANVEGGITLTPALKVHPFIGANDVATLSALPTLFGGEYETKIEASNDSDKLTTSGKLYAIIKAESEVNLKIEILKYLEKIGVEKAPEIKLESEEDVLNIKQLLEEFGGPAKVIEDEKGNKLLDVGLKLGPKDATIQEGVFEEFQGKNPGIVFKRMDDGVYVIINPKEATKMESDHSAFYYSIPGFLNFFSNKTIEGHMFYINKDDYYKDIVIKRNDLLSDGSVIKMHPNLGSLFGQNNNLTNVEAALKESGMSNKLNNPNKDTANVNIGIYNMPAGLQSLNSNEIFDLKADVSELDLGEHEVYVLRKELVVGEAARKSIMERRNGNDITKEYDMDLEKDRLSDTKYYLDKFKITIVDKKLNEEKSTNIVENESELYSNENIDDNKIEYTNPNYVDNTENEVVNSNENSEPNETLGERKTLNTKVEDITEENIIEDNSTVEDVIPVVNY